MNSLDRQKSLWLTIFKLAKLEHAQYRLHSTTTTDLKSVGMQLHEKLTTGWTELLFYP
ncbi:hypothetical protein Mapa_010249 [Marchantia paleacea]|nr:hypothetical protein Mapa_010249 [Marchantia paleacea]